MDEQKRAGDREIIALFPLRTVLVPGLVMPLHIFEPRYRQLIADLSTKPEGQRGFGVAAIREGNEVGADAVRSLYDVGTFAQVQSVEPYPDGRADIVTHGDARFRIIGDTDTGAPYATAEIEWLDEPDGQGDVHRLAELAHRRFREYRAMLSGSSDMDGPADLHDDPRVCSYVIAAALVIDVTERQKLLETESTSDRLQHEIRLLTRELTIFPEVPSLPATEITRVPIQLN
jgi:Lon protease-like protein